MNKILDMDGLFDIICHLLTQPRTLTAKTSMAIINMLNVDEATKGVSSSKVAELEEYEAELLFSPLFTPTNSHRAACEKALSSGGLNFDELGQLQERLFDAKLVCPIVYGLESGDLILPSIVVERYLQLLGLTHSIPEVIVPLLSSAVKESDEDRAFALARRPVWRNTNNCNVLAVCLKQMVDKSSFSADKMDFLTRFVHTYRARELDLLLERLTNMVEAYRRDKDHPVYNRNLAKKTGKIFDAFKL